MSAPKPPQLQVEQDQEAALIAKYGMRPKLSPRLLAKVYRARHTSFCIGDCMHSAHCKSILNLSNHSLHCPGKAGGICTEGWVFDAM